VSVFGSLQGGVFELEGVGLVDAGEDDVVEEEEGEDEEGGEEEGVAEAEGVVGLCVCVCVCVVWGRVEVYECRYMYKC
jgi:hypothetical protein